MPEQSGSEGEWPWLLAQQFSQHGKLFFKLAHGVLLLRLDLWHGHDLVSNSDLLVRAGQSADLAVPLETGQSLHYHVGTSAEDEGDDGSAHVFIALELNPPKSRNPLATLATNLRLHPNQRATAGWLATSAGDFELKIEFKEAELTQKMQ